MMDSMAEAIELAWAAGFIDGEACFSARRRKPNSPTQTIFIYRLMLSISQADPEPLHRMAKIVGHGNVRGPYHHPSKAGLKPVYQWAIHGPRVEHFYNRIEPYMCGPKKNQFKTCLAKCQ